MSENFAMISDGKRFMWDGRLYDTEESALIAEQSYHNDDFEVRVVQRDEYYLLYTRRVVKDIIVAGT
jgi:hypothetical protein